MHLVVSEPPREEVRKREHKQEQVSITPTLWTSGDELALSSWAAQGRRLGVIGRGAGWWIGDWLLYGNESFGERYVRAARITGYGVQTLMNMVYVASRFEGKRRRERLSWSHHAEVAALEPSAQDHWLDRAEAERFSVRVLREAMAREQHPKPRVSAASVPGTEVARSRAELYEEARALDIPRRSQMTKAELEHAVDLAWQHVSPEFDLAATAEDLPADRARLAVSRMSKAWLSQRRSLDDLVEAMMPKSQRVSEPATVLQAQRNAEARQEFLAEHGALDSAGIARMAGSRARNTAALANRWRAEGRIFAVRVDDRLLYPGFQFDVEGRPLALVRDVLAALSQRPELGEWEIALWFTGENGWLDGRRPVDLLERDPEAVVRAAEHETEAVVG